MKKMLASLFRHITWRAVVKATPQVIDTAQSIYHKNFTKSAPPAKVETKLEGDIASLTNKFANFEKTLLKQTNMLNVLSDENTNLKLQQTKLARTNKVLIGLLVIVAIMLLYLLVK